LPQALAVAMRQSYLKDMQVISKYIILRDNRILINGNAISAENNFLNFADYIKSLYKGKQLNYPKFFKMDDLSKLAFVSTELLLAETDFLQKYRGEDIGVIIANSNSSLDTDIKYQATIKDRSNYFPSPALFVYTLANIMIGEICIKNKIFGENTMFVTEKYNPAFLYQYTRYLFDQNKAQTCISGWVDLIGNNYESFLYLVEAEEKSDSNLEYNTENLNKLYNTDF
jgi:hypothetical protein